MTDITTQKINVEISQTAFTVAIASDKVVNIYNDTNAEWGGITGDIQAQNDLKIKLDEITATIEAATTLLNNALALKQDLLGFISQDVAYKGLPGGYASLNSEGKIPQSELDIAPQVNADWNAVGGVAEILNKPGIPSSQVLFYTLYSELPTTGETNKLYFVTSESTLYFWNGYYTNGSQGAPSLNLSNYNNSFYLPVIF